ncbi:MAG TPA: hypothetical protein VMS93_06870 [Candidatus Saccharimonadales bacterium]|nr:hypothetical protein [Candidatus Saccharimonadales bacterium]
MSQLLKSLLAAAVVAALAAAPARAGPTAGASARLYWMAGTASNSTALSGRNSTASVVYLQVTVRGLVTLRGEDIQLIVNSLDAGGLPPAWQATQDGGPAGGNFSPRYHTWAAATYPDIFSTPPAVPNHVLGQTGGFILYQLAVNPCLTPHAVGLIWLEEAGAAGEPRGGAVEYGAYGFQMLLGTGCCRGDNVDPAGPIGVCIAPNWRYPPCSDSYGARKMQLLDTNLQLDLIPFEASYEWLTWHGELKPGSPPNPCWLVTPAQATSWGQIRRLYR